MDMDQFESPLEGLLTVACPYCDKLMCKTDKEIQPHTFAVCDFCEKDVTSKATFYVTVGGKLLNVTGFSSSEIVTILERAAKPSTSPKKVLPPKTKLLQKMFPDTGFSERYKRSVETLQSLKGADFSYMIPDFDKYDIIEEENVNKDSKDKSIPCSEGRFESKSDSETIVQSSGNNKIEASGGEPDDDDVLDVNNYSKQYDFISENPQNVTDAEISESPNENDVVYLDICNLCDNEVYNRHAFCSNVSVYLDEVDVEIQDDGEISPFYLDDEYSEPIFSPSYSNVSDFEDDTPAVTPAVTPAITPATTQPTITTNQYSDISDADSDDCHQSYPSVEDHSRDFVVDEEVKALSAREIYEKDMIAKLSMSKIHVL